LEELETDGRIRVNGKMKRQAEACKTNTTKFQPQQNLEHTTN